MDNTTGCRVVSRRGFLAAAGGGAALGLLGRGRGSAAWGQGQTPEQLIRQAGEIAAAAENDDDWNKVREVVARLNQVQPPDQKRLEDRFHNLYEKKDYINRLGATCALHFNFPSTWGMLNIAFALTIVGNFAEARRALGQVLQDPGHGAFAGLDDCLDRVATKELLFEWRVDPRTNKAYDRNALGGDIRFPLPLNDRPYQQSSYEVVSANASREEMLDGNVALRVTPGDQTAVVRARVTLTPQCFQSQVHDFAEADIPDGVKPFLRSYPPTMVLEDSLVRSVAAELKGATAVESITNVFRWCNEDLDKGPVEGGVMGGLSDVLTRGSTCCETGATAVVGLLRAVGVPARFVRGHGGVNPTKVGETKAPTVHSWADYYIPGVGWLQWDGQTPSESFPGRAAPMFSSPPPHCVGTFTHLRPFAATDGFSQGTASLWCFSAYMDNWDETNSPYTLVGRTP